MGSSSRCSFSPAPAGSRDAAARLPRPVGAARRRGEGAGALPHRLPPSFAASPARFPTATTGRGWRRPRRRAVRPPPARGLLPRPRRSSTSSPPPTLATRCPPPPGGGRHRNPATAGAHPCTSAGCGAPSCNPQRCRLRSSITYEAPPARLRDPVYGSVAQIFALNQKKKGRAEEALGQGRGTTAAAAWRSATWSSATPSTSPTSISRLSMKAADARSTEAGSSQEKQVSLPPLASLTHDDIAGCIIVDEKDEI